MAWVIQDAAPANNGVYQKTGASGSGSWSRLGDLPYSFYRAVNEGAGTANAIQATNGYPMANEDALIVVNITTTNTASPVTLSLNGGTPITIKTAAGNNPAVGGLVAGMMIAGYIDANGTQFRMLSDQTSAAIQSASETAAATAVAARDVATGAMSTFLATVFSIKAVAQAYAPGAAPDYIRLEGYAVVGKGGALYKKVGSEPSHEGKFSITLSDAVTIVWYEIAENQINVDMLGAVGDGDGNTDDTTAINNAAVVAAGKVLCFTSGVNYYITNKIELDPNTIVFGSGATLINTSTSIDVLQIAAGCKVFSLHATGIGTAGGTIADGFKHAYQAVGTSNGAGVAPTYLDGVEIYNCHLTGFRGYGIHGQFLSNFRIEGNIIEDVGYAGIMVLSPLHGWIKTNTVDGVAPGISDSAYGISITRDTVSPNDTDTVASPPPFSVIIESNRVLNNTVYSAYDIHAGNHLHVINNVGFNVALGVNCTFDSPGIEVAYDCLIAWNTLVGTYANAGVRLGGQSSAGPVLTTANKRVQLIGNRLEKFGDESIPIAAIHMFATQGVQVALNEIVEPEWAGINVYFLNAGFRISQNTITSVLSTTTTDPTFILVQSIGNEGYIGENTLQYIATNTPSSYNSKSGIVVQGDSNTNKLAFGRNEITLGTSGGVTYSVPENVKVLKYPNEVIGTVAVSISDVAAQASQAVVFPEFFSAAGPPAHISVELDVFGIGSKVLTARAISKAYTGFTALVGTTDGAVAGVSGTVNVTYCAKGF